MYFICNYWCSVKICFGGLTVSYQYLMYYCYTISTYCPRLCKMMDFSCFSLVQSRFWLYILGYPFYFCTITPCLLSGILYQIQLHAPWQETWTYIQINWGFRQDGHGYNRNWRSGFIQKVSVGVWQYNLWTPSNQRFSSCKGLFTLHFRFLFSWRITMQNYHLVFIYLFFEICIANIENNWKQLKYILCFVKFLFSCKPNTNILLFLPSSPLL